MDEAYSFGTWLKQRRRALDLTQAGLARRLGCATVTLQKIELDERRPSKEMAERLAEALEIEPAERTGFLRSARGELAVDRLATDVVSHAVPPAPWVAVDHARHNLPVQRDPLIGREREVTEVVALLRRAEVGLVTLTGPGGTGKTRLALQVAAELLDDFADGVWFVDLVPITDPALVPTTAAQVFGLKESSGQALIALLQAHLRQKQLLLVLDNFEQVLPAAPLVAELLQATARSKVLVTSREVLRLSGERTYPVPSLALPDPKAHAFPAQLTQYAAVALFIKRAQAAKPDFLVTNQNARAVVEICVRLDGLPLALELAAARVKLLPPEALLHRLEHRLKVLTGGARNLPQRQQTIRAAIDWSYQLLEPEEQALFARLGVFVGGWTIEAAEAVCDMDGDLTFDLLDGLQSLLDKSLVRQTDIGVPRFTMLETILEYALEQLEHREEMEQIRRRHATFCLDQAEAAATDWYTPRQSEAMTALAVEHNNLRAALRWVREAGEAELMLRFSTALAWFWYIRGYFGDVREWLDIALHTEGSGSAAQRGYLLNQVGWIATLQHDFDAAKRYFEGSLSWLSDIDDVRVKSSTLRGLGYLARISGNLTEAEQYLQKSLQICQAAGNSGGVTWSQIDLAVLASEYGDYSRALAQIEAALALFRQSKNPYDIAATLGWLGRTSILSGEYTRAEYAFRECLELQKGLVNIGGITEAIEGLAMVAWTQQDPLRASRLFGTAEVLRTSTGMPLSPAQAYEQQVLAIQSHARMPEWQVAWAEGRAMTVEQAIAYAVVDEPGS